MNKRELQLIEELNAKHYPCRQCEGIHYPRCWMTKTREKLVTVGALVEINCTEISDTHISLRVC